jgi:hypothetical protein
MNVIDEIKSYAELGDDWDGYGAIPVMNSIAEKAIEFLSKLGPDLTSKIDDTYPNTHGTVAIEWVNHRKDKFSIEIGNTWCSYFIMYKDKRPPLMVDRIDGMKEADKIALEINTMLLT